jgi:hypothetical protein
MSNATYLYNIARPAVIIAGRLQGASESVEGTVVVEAPNRVPLPWLFAFLPAHLRPVEVTYQTGPSDWSSRRAILPVASVNDVVHAFMARRPAMTDLVKDDHLADGFIRLMIDGLSALPLPYIGLDPFEVADLNDHEEPSRSVERALGTDAESAAARLALSGFVPGVVPYSADSLFHASPDDLSDAARTQNAVALDPGFLPREQWTTRSFGPPPSGPSTPVIPKKWWQIW